MMPREIIKRAIDGGCDLPESGCNRLTAQILAALEAADYMIVERRGSLELRMEGREAP